MRCRRFSASYFTLIEMLVVIAIIGILASMLMPAMQNAMESSRKVMCANNLKGIGVAQNMYEMDYHWYMPPLLSVAEPFNQHWWAHKLRPYWQDTRVPTTWAEGNELMQTGVLMCPSVSEIGYRTFAYAVNAFEFLSAAPYSMSRCVLEVPNHTFKINSSSRVKDIPPHKIIHMAELGHDSTASMTTSYEIRNRGEFEGTSGLVTPAMRHQMEKNALMLDGHVSSYGIGYISWQLFELD